MIPIPAMIRYSSMGISPARLRDALTGVIGFPVTPFRKVSAIGRFSNSVTESLAGIAEVDLWVAEDESIELHETGLRTIHYGRLAGVDGFLKEYDIPRPVSTRSLETPS